MYHVHTNQLRAHIHPHPASNTLGQYSPAPAPGTRQLRTAQHQSLPKSFILSHPMPAYPALPNSSSETTTEALSHLFLPHLS